MNQSNLLKKYLNSRLLLVFDKGRRGGDREKKKKERGKGQDRTRYLYPLGPLVLAVHLTPYPADPCSALAQCCQTVSSVEQQRSTDDVLAGSGNMDCDCLNFSFNSGATLPKT